MGKDGTTGKDDPGESRGDKVKRQAEEKRQRQAEALRANLLRRKAQSRARTDAPVPPADAAPEEE